MGGMDMTDTPQPSTQGPGMVGGIREFLEAARVAGLATGHFRGLLHIAIGRKITRPDGTTLSLGITWRELAPLLKELRFDRELVREYGADPETLAPRDRERFWYSAIAQAHVDTAEASREADLIIGDLKKLGFVVGPNPVSIATKKPVNKSAKSDKPAKGKKK